MFEFPYRKHKDNAAKYDTNEVATIMDRILKAAKEHGVEIDPDTKD